MLGLAAGTAAVGWRVAHRPAAREAAREVPGGVVVEVLNASGAVGLARAATRRLRDGGLDVVSYGSDAGPVLDSTLVLVRRGDAGAGERVRRVLGVGTVRAAPDAGRLVDITVRLGRDFAGQLAVGGNP